MSYVLLPMDDITSKNSNNLSSCQIKTLTIKTKSNNDNNKLYIPAPYLHSSKVDEEHKDTKGKITTKYRIYYPCEVLLGGYGLYKSLYDTLHNSSKTTIEGVNGKFIETWDMSWDDCTTFYLNNRELNKVNLKGNVQIYFDMEPWSNKRVWIAQPIHIYGYSYLKEDQTMDWTVLMLLMQDVFSYEDTANESNQDKEVVWKKRYEFFTNTKSNRNDLYFEFLYAKTMENSNAWYFGTPGSSNAAVIYIDAMKHFHEIISKKLADG